MFSNEATVIALIYKNENTVTTDCGEVKSDVVTNQPLTAVASTTYPVSSSAAAVILERGAFTLLVLCAELGKYDFKSGMEMD